MLLEAGKYRQGKGKQKQIWNPSNLGTIASRHPFCKLESNLCTNLATHTQVLGICIDTRMRVRSLPDSWEASTKNASQFWKVKGSLLKCGIARVDASKTKVSLPAHIRSESSFNGILRNLPTSHSHPHLARPGRRSDVLTEQPPQPLWPQAGCSLEPEPLSAAQGRALTRPRRRRGPPRDGAHGAQGLADMCQSVWKPWATTWRQSVKTGTPRLFHQEWTEGQLPGRSTYCFLGAQGFDPQLHHLFAWVWCMSLAFEASGLCHSLCSCRLRRLGIAFWRLWYWSWNWSRHLLRLRRELNCYCWTQLHSHWLAYWNATWWKKANPLFLGPACAWTLPWRSRHPCFDPIHWRELPRLATFLSAKGHHGSRNWTWHVAVMLQSLHSFTVKKGTNWTRILFGGDSAQNLVWPNSAGNLSEARTADAVAWAIFPLSVGLRSHMFWLKCLARASAEPHVALVEHKVGGSRRASSS